MVQTIRKHSSSFLFFLIGTGLTLSAASSVLTCLKLIFTDSMISGGKVGTTIFYAFKGVVGSVGAALFSLAFMLVGLQILFAIPWAVIFQKTIEFIRNDFNGWLEARAELKEQVAEGRAAIKAKETASPTDKTTAPIAVAEEIRSMPEIHRSKPEIRRPKAEPVNTLPKREDKQSSPETDHPAEKAVDENGEVKK